MLRISKLNNGRVSQTNTNIRLQTVGETSARDSCKHHTTRHFQLGYIRDKFLIFLKAGAKNVEKNREYNENEPFYRHVWVMFCVAFYRASYKLTDIECSIVAYYKWATKFNLTILTQRVLAKQLGISTSTLILALPRLVDIGILIRITNHKADYSHGNAKCFRYIYKWNPFCESGLKKFKSEIDTLKKSSAEILNRTVPAGVKSQNSCNKNTRLAAPHIQLAECWWEYRQHFHRAEEHNLKKTIYHALKMGIRLPKPGDIEQFRSAIKRAATIPFLKQAHLIGWKEASKSRLVARGGVINDGSKSWSKYGHSTLNFLRFLKHGVEMCY